MNKERSPQSETVAWTGIISDVTLAVAKGSFGYISGSKALMGDALYSGADAAAKLADILPWRSEQGRKSKQRIEERRGTKEPLLAILFRYLFLWGTADRILCNPRLNGWKIIYTRTAGVCNRLSIYSF